MAETVISTKKHILKYGLLLGSVWITYGLIRYLTNNLTTNNWMFPTIELIINICIITYGIYIYKSINGNFLKLGEALKIGLGVIVIGTIIQIFWSIFFV